MNAPTGRPSAAAAAPADTERPGRGGVRSVRIETLHGSLSDPSLDSMTFLNEVAQRYPDAVSFAAGRPHEDLFAVEDLHRHLRVFCDYRATQGWSPEQVRRVLFQYGRTKGIIHDLIALNLDADEGIHADPESIVVTVGCQEAMFLALRALRRDDRDAVLAVSPTYVGLTGAAQLADMPVVPVEAGSEGVSLDAIVRATHQARAEGLRPRACYLIPDFANPLGVRLGLKDRHRLLELAAELDLLILEDNPYGMFPADEDRLPTLKALDSDASVVYLGSFAKTALPGARIGYAVADQRVTDADGRDRGDLAEQMAKLKSMLTVNTSPLAQAVVGGKLIENEFRLFQATAAPRAVYRDNRQLLLDGLAERFPPGSAVTWNTPAGGFFLVLTVPFTTGDDVLEHSARHHGVLWTPMHHFYTGDQPTRQIRLSYSQVRPEEVRIGLDRLAALIAELTGGS